MFGSYLLEYVSSMVFEFGGREKSVVCVPCAIGDNFYSNGTKCSYTTYFLIILKHLNFQNFEV